MAARAAVDSATAAARQLPGSIVLHGVGKVFDDSVAVESIDLEVHDKEFLVLVGPSGCGKTTLLRMIAGLEEVSRGEIRIGGQRVNELPPKNRNIAMVFQNYALYPHMTVYKNMGFGLELRHGTGWLRRAWWRVVNPRRAAELAQQHQRDGEEIRRAARILGIEHLLQRLPRQLSGGERQRVALGRAIVREPAVFLFDEPLSNLDAQLRAEMRREIKDLHRRLAATMVYVTHDQVEALTLGQRIVVMNRGVVQQVGTPREVYAEPKNRFVAGFIGTPPMNFLTGVEAHDGMAMWKRAGAVQPLGAALAARMGRAGLHSCVVGFRPEDVQLVDPAGAPDGVGQRLQLSAVVEVVEPLGDSTLVTVRCGVASVSGSQEIEAESHENKSCHVVIKVDRDAVWQVGQPVTIQVPSQQCHLFDADTGINQVAASG